MWLKLTLHRLLDVTHFLDFKQPIRLWMAESCFWWGGKLPASDISVSASDGMFNASGLFGERYFDFEGLRTISEKSVQILVNSGKFGQIWMIICPNPTEFVRIDLNWSEFVRIIPYCSKLVRIYTIFSRIRPRSSKFFPNIPKFSRIWRIWFELCKIRPGTISRSGKITEDRAVQRLPRKTIHAIMSHPAEA